MKEGNIAKILTFAAIAVVSLSILAAFFYFGTGEWRTPPPQTKKISNLENWIISIPKLNVKAPIILNVRAEDESKYLPALKQGVAHISDTALPGEGNTALFGHSSYYPWNEGEFNEVFKDLDKLEVKDLIILESADRTLEFKVQSKQVVLPSDVEVLKPTPYPALTLITCWPIGTTNERLIIKAK